MAISFIGEGLSFGKGTNTNTNFGWIPIPVPQGKLVIGITNTNFETGKLVTGTTNHVWAQGGPGGS